MARITRNPLPAPLRPEHLGGKETVVCRVKDVLVDVASDKNRRGKATVVILWEYPDLGLYLNETSKDNAIKGMASDESEQWKDKPLPLIVVRSENPQAARDPSIPQYSNKVWVAPPSQWAKLIKENPPEKPKKG